MKFLIFAVGILLAGFFVRYPALKHPLVGHFGSYQTLNAMMAENISFKSWDGLLVPKTMVLMHGKPALHLPYYPFGSLAAAAAKTIFGGPIDFWGRFQASILMVGCGLLVYRITRHFYDEACGLVATAFFTFSPMTMVSGVSFQNEAAALFFLLFSFTLCLRPSFWTAIAAGVLMSLAVIARLHFIFILPVFLYGYFFHFRRIRECIYFLCVFSILVSLWLAGSWSVEKMNEGHIMTSLFDQANEGRVFAVSYFFNPEFYLLLGKSLWLHWIHFLVWPFLLFALFAKNTGFRFWQIWLAGVAFMVVLLPKKIMDHPFYLIGGVPAACILAAAAAQVILRKYNRFAWTIFLIALGGSSSYFFSRPAFSGGVDVVRIPAIGNEIDQLLPPDARIIAQHETTPQLLYYCRRFGWTLDLDMADRELEDQPRFRLLKAEGYGNLIHWLEKLRGEGAEYLVISEITRFRNKLDFSRHMTENYAQVPVTGNEFIVYDLRSPKA